MSRQSNASSHQQRPLPSGYTTIRHILEQSVPVNRFVTVVGLVKDRRAPMSTDKADWKSAITLYDKSIENEDVGLVINIFGPESGMPQPDAGDVVVVVSAKVQLWRGDVSLLTNKASTAIFVYSSRKIPKPPVSAKVALVTSWRPNGLSPAEPGDHQHDYVAWLYYSMDKDHIPDGATFEMKIDQSRNFKDKFRMLKDVRDQQFSDVVVNVVKDPFDQLDISTLWVSDYTENERFYEFSLNPPGLSQARDGDPYGYTTVRNSPSNNWPGPLGKRTMQVTCFGVQAQFIRDHVKAGSWVQLRNLHVKFGRNSNNLEGFIREGRGGYGSGVQIDILATDQPDDRLKAAIKRKLNYEQMRKKQQKQNLGGKAGKGNGNKRRAESQSENNRRTRRTEIQQKWEEEQKLEYQKKANLNDLVKCESLDQPVLAVSSIFEPTLFTTTIDSQEVTLTAPFTCAKYRANVRVVDFQPSKLEDFACCHKKSEYDALSECDDTSDSDEDEDQGTVHPHTRTKTWEWRFALLLEEADPKYKSGGGKLWVVVDNIEAQQLLGLDASDLRAEPKDLSRLQEKLFVLWGNLEERKQQALQLQKRDRLQIATRQPPESSPVRLSGSRPATDDGVSNRAFTCCIRQYGVRVPETDPGKANAGEGKRWERVFGLFGTKICSARD